MRQTAALWTGILCATLILGNHSAWAAGKKSNSGPAPLTDPNSPCAKTVELDKPGQCLDGYPTFEQGGLGICYAVVGAELADSYRMCVLGHHTENYVTSPYPILRHMTEMCQQKARVPFSCDGLTPDKKGSRDFSEGGTPCEILSTISEFGSCNQPDFASKVYKKDSNLRSFVQASGPIPFASPQASEACQIKYAPPSRAKDLATCQPSSDPARNLLAALPRALCQDSMDPACPVPTHPFAGSSCYPLPYWKENLIRSLHDAFNSPQPHPMGLGMCSYAVLAHKPTNTKDTCGPHATLAIGQRMGRNGKCQIKIRNSWGTECSYYHKGIECDPESGSFWINEDELENNLFSVYAP